MFFIILKKKKNYYTNIVYKNNKFCKAKKMFKNNSTNFVRIKRNFKKAFTITEVIVATFISSLVMSFIFIFIFDVVDGIREAKDEVEYLEAVYDFTNQLNVHRNLYIS
jgi:type II secretory pathway pseudopilin PulG